MSTSYFIQGHHVYTICPDIIFQILLPCSRPIMSHHVTCHVTAMSHASSLSIKIKRNSKEKKYKIKKTRQKKEKLLVSKVFHNSYYWFNPCGTLYFWFIYSSYQQQSIAISKNLWLFFNKQLLNFAEFWDFPSNSKEPLYPLVDKEIKKLILYQSSCVKHHGILTRSKNMTIL